MVLVDSLIDTLKLLPILLIVYFLIELLEYKNVFKFEKSKLLNGKASPAIGACIGCIPQCGFSVVSAELFAERKISIGALIAVFIATSDEAFPLMLASINSIPALLMLIAMKLVLAICVGYFAYFVQKAMVKRTKGSAKIESKTTAKSAEMSASDASISKSNENDNIKIENHDHETGEHDEASHRDDESGNSHHNEAAPHHEHDGTLDSGEHSHIHACCHHDIENNKFNFAHPLIHCAKISLYIFLVNFVMGIIISLIGGESKLAQFLISSSDFAPLFAVLVGLIPNCASSVVLTELYMMGGLSFGSIVAGLSVNAGIGLFVLLKSNKRPKENAFIIVTMIISSLIFGYILHYLPFGFLQI